MRRHRRLLFALAAAALALVPAASPLAGLPALALAKAGDAAARLLRITSRAAGDRVFLLLESSAPVAYVTAQPDPLTLLVDLRNVEAGGVRTELAREGRGPVKDVRVEEATAADGVALARVRVLLTEAVPHRVSSERSLIRVDFGRGASLEASGDPGGSSEAEGQPRPAVIRLTGSSGPGGPPVATVLRAIETTTAADGVQVALKGNGRLEASAITEAQDPPPRLVLDFADVRSGVPDMTAIGVGPIARIRVAAHSHEPLITRVVFDLTREADYRIEPPEPDERDLTVYFPAATDGQAVAPAPPAAPEAGPAASTILLDPMAALRSPPAAAIARLEAGAWDGPDIPASTGPTLVTDSAGASGTSAEPRPDSSGADQAPPDAPRDPRSEVDGEARQDPPPQPAPAPAPPLEAQLQTPVAPGERQFTGHPISLDFQQADLRAVLRTFAEISGLNIVIDPNVQGTVDVRLTDVPWDQALDIILRANRLGYVVDGTIIRIAPLATLTAEAEERRKLAEAEALSGELQVMTHTLSYSRATNIAQLLTRTVLSQRGQVQVDERTNTLIISDLSDRLQAARDLIATLDRPEPQVEIEARIVQTSRDFARELGIQWGFTGRAVPELGNTTPLSFPNRGTLGGRAGTQGPAGVDPRAGPLEQVPSAVDLPTSTQPTSAVGLALGAVNGAFNLDVALSALENTGRLRVLSTPRVTTQNNVPAEMTQGTQIPIQTVANNTVTVTFKDAALILNVTPQITAADTVIMNISLENASPDFSRAINGIPPIDTQRANTTLQVADGQTTVIGGVFVSSEQSNIGRTPFLHRIPLFGWLFKNTAVNDQTTELLIFVTPRIVR